MSPTLLISNYNGREFVSVEFSDPHREARLGTFRRTPITDEQATMTLEALRELYEQSKVDASERNIKKAKMSELLGRLAEIIRQSHHEGERENAKALYLKFAGKPFDR